jgi:hypothetical protein
MAASKIDLKEQYNYAAIFSPSFLNKFRQKGHVWLFRSSDCLLRKRIKALKACSGMKLPRLVRGITSAPFQAVAQLSHCDWCGTTSLE